MKKINYKALKGIPAKKALIAFKALIEREEERLRALHAKSLDEDFDLEEARSAMLAIRLAYRQLEVLLSMPNTLKDITRRIDTFGTPKAPTPAKLF